MSFFQEKNLPRIKDGAYLINLDDKTSKETHTGFYYLLIEMQMFTLILLESPGSIEHDERSINYSQYI